MMPEDNSMMAFANVISLSEQSLFITIERIARDKFAQMKANATSDAFSLSLPPPSTRKSRPPNSAPAAVRATCGFEKPRSMIIEQIDLKSRFGHLPDSTFSEPLEGDQGHR